MTSKNDNALAIARKILDRPMCRIIHREPAARSRMTAPDPSTATGDREIVR